MLDINVNDMLVFEDEYGNIYRDHIDAINKYPVNMGVSEYCHCTYTEIACNNFVLKLDDLDFIFDIHMDCAVIDTHKYKLKQIWTRTDEDLWHLQESLE